MRRDVIALVCGLTCCLCLSANAAPLVRSLSLVSNDVEYDAANQRLYASIPSSVGASGNSLQIVDPVAGTVGSYVFVGSEPGKIAVSGNGQYAYVGLNGAPAVRRVDLATFTAGLQFSLGSDSFLGPFYVDDIEAMPGSPQTVAVARRNVGFSPRHEGVAIFDDGVMRTVTTPDHTGSNVIEFGTNPLTLYGYNNETTDFRFRTMAISSTGVQITDATSGLISGFGSDFAIGGNIVVSSTGKVINAANRSLLGTLASTGPVAVESDGLRAYIVSGNAVNVYDTQTFLKVDTITVPGLTGGAEIVRWGVDGLAVRTPTTLHLINSSSVPEPSSCFAAAATITMLARRRRRR